MWQQSEQINNIVSWHVSGGMSWSSQRLSFTTARPMLCSVPVMQDIKVSPALLSILHTSPAAPWLLDRVDLPASPPPSRACTLPDVYPYHCQCDLRITKCTLCKAARNILTQSTAANLCRWFTHFNLCLCAGRLTGGIKADSYGLTRPWQL